jgi:hypothetical protein
MNDWLTEEQVQAVAKIVPRKRGIVWWKVGEGKTRIALEIYIRLTQCNKKLLVVCSPQAFRAWRDEAALHPVFGHLIWLEFLSSGVLSTKTGDGWVKRLQSNPQIGMVVVDELWMYKKISTQRSKRIQKLTEHIPTVGLSGSLITNRNIEDIYGQSAAVGLGLQVAKSLTHFRTQFCVSYEDFGLKFAAKRGALEAIQRRLAPYCDIYFPDDVRESRVYRTTVDPTSEQLILFDTCQKDYYAKLTNDRELEIRSAAVLITKLQQISDGVVLDGEGQEVSIRSAKFEHLLGILDEFSESRQRVIVWFAFKASLNLVYQTLGTQACTLSGGTAFDSAGWRNGKYQVCLATVGSGASLNDFADIQHAIIYSAPFSYRAIQQAMGRTNRKSSKHAVCYYQFLQTDKGVDSLMYDTVNLTGEIEKTAIQSSVDIIRKYLENYGRKNFI